MQIANDTEFGLTGAVYTGSQDKIDRAIREFHVGNLYINRKCTGAMVGAHPFGGFNMSGTDSKAGGPDYLYLFTQAKSVAEKIRARRNRVERTLLSAAFDFVRFMQFESEGKKRTRVLRSTRSHAKSTTALPAPAVARLQRWLRQLHSGSGDES